MKSMTVAAALSALAFLLNLQSDVMAGKQEKPNNGVLVRSGSPNQTKGKPVIVKGEVVHFDGRYYVKDSKPFPKSLTTAAFKSAESTGSGKDNIEVKIAEGGISISVEGKKVGTATIRFQLESVNLKGVITSETEVEVIPQMDEFPIYFHFVRANRQPGNVSVVTNRIDDLLGSAEKRQTVVDLMLQMTNKIWEQVGLKFTAEHGVTAPSNPVEQDYVNLSFNGDGAFDPSTAPAEFFTTFNKPGMINIYLVKAVVGDAESETERGVAATDYLEPAKDQKVYAGGRLIKKAYGAVLSDKAGKEDPAHEIGHLMGLRDQAAVGGLENVPGIVTIQELDGIDKLNHRGERVESTAREHNLMRAPVWPVNPEPTLILITEGQAKHSRSQLGTLKWSG